MANPQAVINKKGPIAAQNQHLGRTYVSKLYPVPVSDAAYGGLTSVSVMLEQVGILVDVGLPDNVSGGVAVVGVELYTPSVHLDDTVHSTGVILEGVSLKTPQIDTVMQPDNSHSTGPALDGVSLRVAHVMPPMLSDNVRSSGISGVDVTLITN